jgi:hypothetical protein
MSEAVVVRNLGTGAQFRMPGDASRLNVVDMDVDAGGAVAFLHHDPTSSIVSWAAPGNPVVRSRRLPRRWPTLGIELSDGVVAMLQAPLRGFRERGRVVLTELDEEARLRTVGTGLDTASGLRVPLDFDGERLAGDAHPTDRVDRL